VDNSKFVLRWEIDYARATIAKRKDESAVFKAGGLEWIADLRPKNGYDEYSCFTLTCGNQREGEWKCEADVEFVIFSSRRNEHEKVERVEFNNGEPVNALDWWSWRHHLSVANSGFINKDKIVVEYRVSIISSEGCESPQILDLDKFASPNEMSNVTLVI
ncbi:hypothetical protein PENTCL1PPCAC_24733, partial [Pristionchus entomophagus]